MKVALSAAAACALFASSVLAADPPKLPEGEGRETTVRLCGTCHAAEIVMSRRESIEGWSGVVEDMMRRGLRGSDEEFGEVVDYLVAHFPRGTPLAKVNVNKADKTQLVSSLGLTDTQAASLLKYRTANGNFRAIEDLEKVPGISANFIQAKKNRIEF
jgi:competence protein ComEA